MKLVLIFIFVLVFTCLGFCAEIIVKPNSKTDCSKEIQKALDDCFASGGGVVDLGSGQYRLDNSIEIPSGVTLAGVWQGPHHTELDKGTVIMAYAGRGKENDPPLVKLEPNSTIKGMTIYYPEQTPDNIVPYPWTIQGSGMHPSVMDITIPNCYNGIDFGTFTNELHYIRNVYGSPLNLGIYIDKCTDIGRVENVHFNMHYWTRAEPDKPQSYWDPLFRHSYLNVTGFKIGRADWEMFSNTFIITAKIGYHFISDSYGASCGVFSQIACDYSQIPILIDQTQPSGISITNGQFVAGDAAHYESIVKTSPAFTGNVKFSNTNFWGPAFQIADIEGNGHVSFNQCNFSSWPFAKKTGVLLDIKGGSVTVTNCVMAKEWDIIKLGKDVDSAIIKDNTFASAVSFENNANDADVIFKDNVIRKKAPDYVDNK